jgi:hypothetical protein
MATGTQQAPAQQVTAKNEGIVKVPMRRTNGYVTRRIDTQLPAEHAQVLRDIFDGLHAQHAKLKNGKHVDNHRDALLYLLENVKPA